MRPWFTFAVGTVVAAAAAWGQSNPYFSTSRPDRGTMPFGAYALSDLESIDQASGGLGLRIPLASLPPGRGGFSHSLALVYSSQVYDLATVAGAPWNTYCGSAGCPDVVNALEPATNAGGGWQYSVSYRFEVVPRSGTESFGGPCSGQPSVEVSTNFYRYSLVFPDGSSHLLRMEGGAAGTPDGYYPHGPDGRHVCAVFNPQLPPLPLPLRFHTTDGTYVQVTRSANGWRAVFPDGRQVATDSTAWVAMARSICDRNSHCVRITFEVDDTDGTPLVHVIDDFGRRIRIKHLNTRPEYCADITSCFNSADEIYQSGYGDPPTDPANRASNRWTVTWGYSSIGYGGQGRLAYSCGSPTNDWRHSGQCTLARIIRNVQQIELPTSTAGSQRYQFCYADDNAPAAAQGYGELISIGLPNGTSSAHSCATPSSFRPRVEYTYRYSRNRGRVAQVDSENAVLSKTLFRREVEPAGSDVSETWSYTYPETGRASGTITGPDGGTTTNEFYDPGVASGLRRLLKKTTSPLGATIEKIWAQNEPWIGVNAPLDRKNAYVQVEYRKPAGVAAESATAYELDKNGNLLSETVYDSGVGRGAGGFPSGSVLRKTTHTYSFPTPKASEALAGSSCGGAFGNAYWGCNQGLIYKQARSRTAVTGVSTGPESATEWSYGSPATTANVLEERRWDSTKEAALPASLNASNAEITSFTWSDRGNLQTTTTPDGDKTTIERGSSGCGSDLYPTRVTRHDQNAAFQLTEDLSYDCATGVTTRSTTNATDPSRSVREVTAYDKYARPDLTYTETGSGNLRWRQKSIKYDDQALSVREVTSVDSPDDTRMATVVRYNPAGFPDRRQWSDEASGAVTNGSAAGVVSVYAYRYSGPWRFELESVPYSAQGTAAGIPLAWRRRQFDQDGRLIREDVFRRDDIPGTAPSPWGTAANVVSSQTWSYNGYSVTITDGAGKWRTETRDALGRLVGVAQPGSAATTYSYPARQMVVTQSDNDVTQTRTFTYTSLGRLASAENPESGTTTYTYYPGGALWTTTTANGNTTTLSYDGGQRLSKKSYNHAGTLEIEYCYDGNRYQGGTCVGDPTNRAADTADFPKGQLTGFGNALASTNYEQIDALGRVTRLRQWVDGLVVPGAQTPGGPVIPSAELKYTYGSGGAVKSITYPSGRVVTYTLGDTGRATQVSGSFKNVATAYGSAVAYTPGGGMRSANWAGGRLQETWIYNELGQATQIAVMRNGAQLVHRLGYSYPATGNNGNVSGHSMETPMGGWNQYFGYDGANRLRLAMERRGGAPGNVDSVSCSGTQTNWTGGEWCQQFGFDGFGNIWSEAGQTQGTTALVANGPAWYDQAKNRLRNVVYDAAGNQTQLQVNDASVVTEYDGEGRILRRRSGGGVLFEYWYGPGGQRVQTRVGSVVTRYVYGMDGELVAEYGGEGTSGGAKPEYLLTDTLGSTRGKTDGEGLVLARFDYEPFGGEIGRNGSARDGLRQRFTGKERDALSDGTPTGLDYFGARYMSAAMGRFTSADAPFADQNTSDPQSWNLYSYGRNNPLLYVDPNGNYVCASSVTAEQCDSFQQSLDQAQTAANALKDKYGADLKQYIDAQASISSYGARGKDNGVTIAIGDTGKNGAITTVANSAGPITGDNKNGQSITVTFNAATIGNTTLAAHEGSHVADGSAYVSSGFNQALNPTNRQTETKAFQVQSNIGIGMGWQFQTVTYGGHAPYLLNVTGWPKVNTDNMINAILNQQYRNLDQKAFSLPAPRRRR